jgi:DNA-binding HxlR family transcriptional regulator
MSSILPRTVPPRPFGVIGGDAGPTTHPVMPPSMRCPVEATLTVLGDRWTALVVWHLFWGARPFCELMRQTPGISKKNLRHVLAGMEQMGLVRKEVRPGGGRRAEYSLTPFGETLKPIVGAMYEWGLKLVTPTPGATPRIVARELALSAIQESRLTTT